MLLNKELCLHATVTYNRSLVTVYSPVLHYHYHLVHTNQRVLANVYQVIYNLNSPEWLGNSDMTH